MKHVTPSLSVLIVIKIIACLYRIETLQIQFFSRFIRVISNFKNIQEFIFAVIQVISLNAVSFIVIPITTGSRLNVFFAIFYGGLK